ncbi:MAG: type II secretion system protein [Bacilli bacterium]|nr:type II secretion system protein [Bacilli bacterium]
MKRKKGFTLLELLAVIVVITIFSLVVVPFIIGIINKARLNAFIQTGYGILDAAENYYVNQLLYNTVTDNVTVSFDDYKNQLSFKGKKPDGGIVILKKTGNSTLALWSESLRRCIIKNYNTSKIMALPSTYERDDCSIGIGNIESGNIWDGWIKLTLYYPDNAIEKKWRLDARGDIRTEGQESWQDYEGSITIPLDRIEDVFIKYKLPDGTTVISGNGAYVDIEPSSYTYKTGDKITVKLNYSTANLESIQYMIGNNGWTDYINEFIVEESTVISAKLRIRENVYDSTGNILTQRTKTVYDSVYIRPYDEKILTSCEDNDSCKVDSGSITEMSYPPVSQSSTPERITNLLPYRAETIGPYLTIDNNNLTCDSVKVNLTTSQAARVIYYKIGTGSYKKYTQPFTITSNVAISTYYIKDDVDGTQSMVETYKIRNIKDCSGGSSDSGKAPYIKIDANPYPSKNSFLTDSVRIGISYESTADTVEYSLDGINYKNYTGTFLIKNNLTVYARAKNEFGTREDSLAITNIGDAKNGLPSPSVFKPYSLAVSILATPEDDVSLVDSTTVSITYDSRATEKYYKIGQFGDWIKYTEPFVLEENSTVYAYAQNDIARGSAYKKIDYLTTGISEPIITVNSNTYSADVSISFDKNSFLSQYKIGDGNWSTYTGPFTVTENTVVYAQNINILEQSETVSKKIDNISAKPPVYILNMGKYYIIKLNYPENASRGTWEYKYKEDGTWKLYKDDGILLVEQGSEILNNSIIKIKDETGKEIEFNGDYYILTSATSEIANDIYMRFAAEKPASPTIVADTTEPSKEVKISIDYPGTLRKKQYMIAYSDGTKTDWLKYENPFLVDKNNAIIYARSQNASEVWSLDAKYIIKNIDEKSPVIKLTADLETITKSVSVLVTATDDVKLSNVMYDIGLKGASYFETNGNSIPNNSTVKLTQNGTYTFYASDYAGNTKTYTLTVDNIDSNAPEVVITAVPLELTTNVTVSMDFGDATIRQYKIGANTIPWTNYTSDFALSSSYVLSNKLENSDGTVTVCGQGTDAVGNVTKTCKKILNLDVTKIEAPVITSNYGNAVISIYGIGVDGKTTIEYDQRNDITNYYSLDGVNWNIYTGAFDASKTNTIYAKSVKNDSGLFVSSTKANSQPANALPIASYDGDTSTYVGATCGSGSDTNICYSKDYFINVDSSMYNQKINMNIYSQRAYYNDYTKVVVYAYNSANALLNTTYIRETGNYTIPENTTYLKIHLEIRSGYGATSVRIYELSVYNEPTFNATQYFPTITNLGMNSAYTNVSLNYNKTSIIKQYSLDEGITWYNYMNQSFKLASGKKLLAKGYDKNNIMTKLATYNAIDRANSLTPEAYDGDNSTYVGATCGSGSDTNICYSKDYYVAVDSSMYNEKIYMNVYSQRAYSNDYTKIIISAYNSSNTLINSAYIRESGTYTIPDNTAYLQIHLEIRSGYGLTSVRIYELSVYNDPIFNATQYFPAITNSGVNSAYTNVSLSYHKTSVVKQYSLDGGTTWHNYLNQTFKLASGQNLLARGYDKNNVMTRISTYSATDRANSLTMEAFDNNTLTYVGTTCGSGSDTNICYTKNYYVAVDSSMYNKNVNLNVYSQRAYSSDYTKIIMNAYNSSNTLISSTYIRESKAYTIPENTAYIRIYLEIRSGYGSTSVRIYELSV